MRQKETACFDSFHACGETMVPLLPRGKPMFVHGLEKDFAIGWFEKFRGSEAEEDE